MIIGICMAIPESIKFGMYDLHAMNPKRFPNHYTICTNKMSENEIKALSIGIFVVKVQRSWDYDHIVSYGITSIIQYFYNGIIESYSSMKILILDKSSSV